MTTALEIDGRHGGGQLLRSALTLSLLTGRPFHMRQIRGARPSPGLKRQHLACVRAALAVSGGSAEGAAPASTDLRFQPGAVRAGDHEFRIDGAGSTSLVLQTVLLPLLSADGASVLRLTGGTHNPLAPSFDYLDRVFLPRLRAGGALVDLNLVRAGFMPAGGGAIECRLNGPTRWQPLDQSGDDAGADADPRLRLIIRHAHLNPDVIRRAIEAVERRLAPPDGDPGPRLRLHEVTDIPHPEALCGGLALILESRSAVESNATREARRAQATGFGARGVRTEQIADAVTRAMRQHLAARVAIDLHLADQLLLPLAVAGGSFRAAGATAHTKSNAALIDAFLPGRLQLDATDDRRLLVRSHGEPARREQTPARSLTPS